MNKNKIGLILISFLLLTSLVCLIPQAEATTTIIKSYTTTPDSSYYFRNVPSTPASNLVAYGMYFVASNTGYANQLTVLLSAGSTETTYGAYFTANLYAGNTSTHLPEGSTLEGANNLVTVTGADYNVNGKWVTFSFDQTTLLTSGQAYVFMINCQSTMGTVFNSDSNNWMGFPLKTAALSGGYSIKEPQTGGFALTSSNYAFNFILYGDTSATPTPTPIPTPTPTPTDDYKWDENTNSWSWWNGTHWIPSSGPSPTANAQITTFTGNMITYIVPCALLLLPAVVGAWALGKAGAAKWGFIAGLNIGAIMCYLYLPSFGLWAVIAIVLVDVVMIFASQRGE